MSVDGYAQVDWVLLDQTSSDEVDSGNGAPKNQERFVLRRGRVRIASEQRYTSADLELDANTVTGSQVRPIDAQVAVRWPSHPRPGAAQVSAGLGLMRIPYGFDVQVPTRERPFLEATTTAAALFPGLYDLGLRFEGGYRIWRWKLALMNGNPVGDATFPAQNPTTSKDVLLRLQITPSDSDPHLAFGVSTLTGLGFHSGAPSTKDVLTWRDLNEDGIVQATELQVIPGAPAEASQQFKRFALGADAQVGVEIPMLGLLQLQAEITLAQNLDRGVQPSDPVSAGRNLSQLGWSLALTQGVDSWGLIAVRYDSYDPDVDRSEQIGLRQVPRDASRCTWSFVIGVEHRDEPSQPTADARLLLEYELRRNSLGRDESGDTANLKSDSLTLRGEVGF